MNFLFRKSYFILVTLKYNFAKPKIQIKTSKNMFYDNYTQRHKTPLRQLYAYYFVNNDYCTLRMLRFFKNISSTTK